ncbi:MAG: Crp/Fnr family transcriptional regulator [Marinilabiliales bacterium]|nr:MAG: Crp/Fnr family transcriptional regulator [Marinilabiliales bacterium]
MKDILAAIFPYLNEADLLLEIEKNAKLIQFDDGDIIIEQHSRITFVPLITKGEIKIIQHTDKGNSLYLYSLYRGDICAMSVTCCLDNKNTDLSAISSGISEILAIPSHLMDEWIVKYRIWRSFIFSNYNNKFTELLHSLNNVAFLNLDERLVKYLVVRADKNKNVIKTTHKKIAEELNSSREVISRLLKTLENKGKIELHRNEIRLIDLE